MLIPGDLLVIHCYSTDLALNLSGDKDKGNKAICNNEANSQSQKSKS